MASTAPLSSADTVQTVRINLSGHVQGVGFRPFVYRLAQQYGLTGEVLNKVGDVEIVASGNRNKLESFAKDLVDCAPPLANPELRSVTEIGLRRFAAFTIAESAAGSAAKIFVPPDYFMCDDCCAELTDPADRRFRYPFINCTQCGPRYTLIDKLPYDRQNTSMSGFRLCAACRTEYEDPADRRFHAEPVACPECGPQVRFELVTDDISLAGEAALEAGLALLAAGKILAVKGVGGYHLMCDASDPAAVARLRLQKHRPDKPLAVMFPLPGGDGLEALGQAVRLTAAEAALLTGPVRPIVLARKRDDSGLAENLAPGLRELGVFLPYAPLHQLLLSGFGGPLVATSGNISGEPVLTDNQEASKRLAAIADGFLDHDRPILRPADDPVFRTVAGAPRPLRIGRGVAPRELDLAWRLREPVVAVGGHMKGTVAIAWDDRAVVSPHIGEMDSPRSMAVFESVLGDLQALYNIRAERVLCDAHPGYATHRWANSQSLPVTKVWHHLAHASAIAAEFPADGNWLVFAWDGVGLGPDESLWGGEALIGRPGDWRRVASMRPFRLPGGERAGREPWRSAAALCWEAGHSTAFAQDPDGLLSGAWQRNINSPRSSAVGRIFDAAASMVCDAHTVSFEAQGPMMLEALCSPATEVIPLTLAEDENGILRSDWAALLPMLGDSSRSTGERATVFHNSMAAALVAQATEICSRFEVRQIGLAGGVFQNRVLTDEVMRLLADGGHSVFIGESLPCNDAAISFGQVAEFAAEERG